MINTKQVMLITWASSGIGKDMAMTFVNEWYTVYGAARRMEKMQDIADAGWHILQMDISDEDQIAAAINTIISEQWQIDVLINNAWFSMSGAVEEVSMEDAKYQFEVNVFGLARMTQLVLPHMRTQKSWKIVNISSIAGKMTFPYMWWYHASKHAVESLSDALRIEVKDFWIDVIVIEPWIIKTEFGEAVDHHMIDKYNDWPYAHRADLYQQAMQKSYDPSGSASSPSVITDIVHKAITTHSPRPRYHAGKFSSTLFFLKRLLPDRLFDKFAIKMFS